MNEKITEALIAWLNTEVADEALAFSEQFAQDHCSGGSYEDYLTLAMTFYAGYVAALRAQLTK